MKSRSIRIILTIVCVILVAFLLVNSCARQDKQPDTEPPASPSDVTVPPEEATPQVTEELPASGSDIVVEPPASDSDIPEPLPVETPVPASGLLGLSAEPVDDEWFSDAAFLGNSLVDGFRLFSGLTTSDYYAATSMTVLGAGGLIEQMSAKQYGKVYILLGINEIGYNADVFKGQYSDMLDTIMEQQPDADIYVMGLTPVSEYKSTTDTTFTMERVKLYNEKLLELAEEKGCYYLDLVEALADETGYLPANVTSDGVHFSAGHYQVWNEYLHTHHA